jgi:GTP-binding protein Era
MGKSKSGFVSIVGKPNVGKSTLLNRLIGMKLAGVSKKAQTTRRVVRGILNDNRGQVVFLDTPGFHKPKDELGSFMVREATKTFLDADIFYFMADPVLPTAEDLILLERIKKELGPRQPSGESGQAQINKPVFCVINKVDEVEKDLLLPVLDSYHKQFPFSELIPISALRGDQVDLLLSKTFDCLPEHEPYFPPDITSDQTEKFIAEEMVREKIFRFTGEEIPYATAVEIEEFKEEDRLVRIGATVFVEKDSQKAILIGKGGQKMKQIGMAARRDLERFLEKKVFLQLWVKTLKNWKKDEKSLKRLGFG